MSVPEQVVILVPAYRCAETIAETLRSIQEQGPALARVREVIIADDGSHDNTPEIARSIWQSRTPLRILEREFNCGEYASVNNAVEQFAPGTEWFFILHADDIAKPGWLEVFLDRILKAPDRVASICSSYDTFDNSGKVGPGEDKPGAPIVTVEGTAESVADTLLRGCWWHISACAIRVSAFREVGGLPKIMLASGDWDFLLRLLASGWSIEYIPRALMLYRSNPLGSSSVASRTHADVRDMLLVVGRFRWALGASALARKHALYVWFLARRFARSVISLDPIRAIWVFPALAYTVASYWACLLTPRGEPKIPAEPPDVRASQGRIGRESDQRT